MYMIFLQRSTWSGDAAQFKALKILCSLGDSFFAPRKAVMILLGSCSKFPLCCMCLLVRLLLWNVLLCVALVYALYFHFHLTTVTMQPLAPPFSLGMKVRGWITPYLISRGYTCYLLTCYHGCKISNQTG